MYNSVEVEWFNDHVWICAGGAGKPASLPQPAQSQRKTSLLQHHRFAHETVSQRIESDGLAP